LARDYRPISRAHNFAKLISKVLANRLGPHLDQLVSVNQAAFMKKRCIHESFMYIQEVLKHLHKRKIHAIFIKIDIAKAFDTVNLPYLMHVMKYLGFGLRWRNWVSSLWCSSSSSFLLNVEAGKRILYCRGVRQGDPLSPMLFILAMGPLRRLFSKAQSMGIPDSLSPGYDTFRMSLCADAAVIFINLLNMI
jgi:hypothetical protein